jgi:hypothetical protein
MGVVNCPASLFSCQISAKGGGAAWGMLFVIYGEGVWRNIAGQGCIELQFNSFQWQYSQKYSNQPALLSLFQNAPILGGMGQFYVYW